jgi:hypothetical protein
MPGYRRQVAETFIGEKYVSKNFVRKNKTHLIGLFLIFRDR